MKQRIKNKWIKGIKNNKSNVQAVPKECGKILNRTEKKKEKKEMKK